MMRLDDSFKSISAIGIILLLQLVPAFASASAYVYTLVILTNGTTWTVPSDWNSASNTIEVIGGGGNGGQGSTIYSYGGGGGGGYAKIRNVSLTPGATVSYWIGGGGIGFNNAANASNASGGTTSGNGGSTWFNGPSCALASVCATGGAQGNGQTGGAGGAPVGSASGYAGGAGGNTTAIMTNWYAAAGGGGGAGGPYGAGGAGGAGIGSNLNCLYGCTGTVVWPYNYTYGFGAGGGGGGGGTAAPSAAAGGGAAASGNNYWRNDAGGGLHEVCYNGGCTTATTTSFGGGGGWGMNSSITNMYYWQGGGTGAEWILPSALSSGSYAYNTSGYSSPSMYFAGSGGGGGGGGNGQPNSPSYSNWCGSSTGAQGGYYGGGGGGESLDASSLAYYNSNYCNTSAPGVPPGSAPGAPGVIAITYTGIPQCSVTFTANPVSAGASDTITIKTSDAAWATVNTIGAISPNTTYTATIPTTATTDYTCTVANAAGTQYQTPATLVVNQPPQCTLAVSPSTIGKGSSATLSYTSANATSMTISPTIGSFTPSSSGSFSVSPTSNTTYTGTATGAGGTASCTTPVASTTAVSIACTASTTYSCNGLSTITQTSTSTSCAVTTNNNYASCASPSFCNAGSSTCYYSTPDFTPLGAQSGNLTLLPSLMRAGNTASVFWNVLAGSAVSCSVMGSNGDSWAGLSSGLTGVTTSPITQQTKYTLSCLNADGVTRTTQTQTVNIVPGFQER